MATSMLIIIGIETSRVNEPTMVKTPPMHSV